MAVSISKMLLKSLRNWRGKVIGQEIFQTQEEKERIERLEKYIVKVDESLGKIAEELKEYGQVSYMSEQDIQRELSTLPDLIADANLLLSKIQRAYDYAKDDSKRQIAKLWGQYTKRKDILGLNNQKEQEAWVVQNEEYMRVVRIEIEWKYQVQRAKSIVDRYENKFASARKLANLIEKDQSNNYRRESYGGQL